MKLKLQLLTLLACFAFTSKAGESGTLNFSGVVYGYKESSKSIFKLNKQTVLEGALEGVSIEVREDDAILQNIKTDAKGEFTISMKPGKAYKLLFQSTGYSSISVIVDARQMPLEKEKYPARFTGAEFILYRGKKNNTAPIGRLYYDPQRMAMEFKAENPNSKNQEVRNAVELIQKAVTKNKNRLFNLSSKTQNSEKTKQTDENNTPAKNITKTENVPLPSYTNELTEEEILNTEADVIKAREELERDKLKRPLTPEDSLDLLQREERINAAELRLAKAKKIIALQEKSLSDQKKITYLSFLALLAAIAIGGIIYYHFRKKKQLSIALKNTNKKITDSINYAKRIQQSILIPQKEIEKHLKDLFIYYEPKSIVSGDFYWFSKIENKILVAAVDCTGHGVPGAFMSLIGNSILNRVINEQKITEPDEILNRLHDEVTKTLKQSDPDNDSHDGMELAFCCINMLNNTIKYAGAMNPVYIIENDQLKVLTPNLSSIGGTFINRKQSAMNFSSETVEIKPGMAVYLFTDGFMDQFGGSNDEKYNTSRFKKLLLNNSSKPMREQKDIIEKEMLSWKGNKPQTDDILLIGLKF